MRGPLDEPSLQDLLAASREQFSPRAWVKEGPIACYVRITARYVNGDMTHTIDLANIQVEERQQGKGHFTAWLAHVEALARKHHRTVYVELVHNARLQHFLERRGYTRLPNPGTSPHYVLAPHA